MEKLEKRAILVIAISVMYIVGVCVNVSYWDNIEHYRMDCEEEAVVHIEDGYFDVSPIEFVNLINERTNGYGIEEFSTSGICYQKKLIPWEEYGHSEVILNTEFIYKTIGKSIYIKFITADSKESVGVELAGNEKYIDTVVVCARYTEEPDKSVQGELSQYYRLLASIVNPSINVEKLVENYTYDTVEVDKMIFYQWNSIGEKSKTDSSDYEYYFGVMAKPDIKLYRDVDSIDIVYNEE